MGKIKFGTSGFRGIFADNFTKENVQKVAFAVCAKIKEMGAENTVVPFGYDNRFMGKEFTKWMIEVFAYEGIKTKFFEEPTPSPLIAFEAKNLEFGIHITASHNPYFYNGIKIFMKGGRETPFEFNEYFEQVANKTRKVLSLDFEIALENGLVEITNNIENYVDAMLKFVDVKRIKKAQPKVLFNAMHGSTVKTMELVFKKLGIKHFEIMKNKRDSYFEYKVTAPYVHNITDQIDKMKKSKFDVGFALDGDGDRFTAVDKNGTPYDCNYLSALFLNHLKQNGEEKSLVVKNCALSHLLKLTAKHHSCETKDAKVGFKNIAEIMINDETALIGVESNGIALKEHILHKDGTMMAILLLDIVAQNKVKTLTQMINDLKEKFDFPSETIEYAYPITDEKKAEINKLVFEDRVLPKMPEEILRTTYEDGFKMYFEKNYWAVIRFSGNENVVRLFAETKDAKTSEKYIKTLEKFIGVKEKQ